MPHVPWIAALLLLLPLPGMAKAMPVQLEARLREVEALRDPGQRTWLELHCEIEWKNGEAGAAAVPGLLRDLTVVVTAAFAVDQSVAADRLVFCRGELQVPVMPRGRHSLRLYVPPGVLGALRLNQRPREWMIEIRGGPDLQADVHRAHSPGLEAAERRSRFAAMADSRHRELPAMVGLEQTPFHHEARRLAGALVTQTVRP